MGERLEVGSQKLGQLSRSDCPANLTVIVVYLLFILGSGPLERALNGVVTVKVFLLQANISYAFVTLSWLKYAMSSRCIADFRFQCCITVG